MARLPDRFDLWVRRARQSTDVERQADYVLGALAALRDWHFLNLATQEQPQPAEAELDGAPHLLVFSDPQRLEEVAGPELNLPAPLISMPTAQAMPWVLERGAGHPDAGLLINPGDDAFAVSLARLRVFYDEWKSRSGLLASGFWIPSMTSEEEDFWQEHGL